MVLLQHDVLEESPLRDAVAGPSHGAVLTFRGTTRDHHNGRRVVGLSYEAYPELAIPVLETILEEAARLFSGARVAVAHRLGPVPVGDDSVLVVAAAAHRAECYEANRYVIDQLKSRAAIWKKEHYEDGSAWKANTPSPP